MPTQNPRITITLPPAVAAVLRNLSEVTGNSQSAIVGELLGMSVPIFERVVTAITVAKSVEENAKTEIAQSLDSAQTKIERQLGLALGHMEEGFLPILEEAEKIARRRPRGGRRAASRPSAGSTPVPVTRGSGPGKTLKGPVKRVGRG